MHATAAGPGDAEAIARIYNQGIEERIHANHARLDGLWRDDVVVERLIPTNL